MLDPRRVLMALVRRKRVGLRISGSGCQIRHKRDSFVTSWVHGFTVYGFSEVAHTTVHLWWVVGVVGGGLRR